MEQEYNAEDYGPGKQVSPLMAEVFFKNNAHKIVMMLMLRLNQRSITISAEDVRALMALPQGSALLTQHTAEGIRLMIAGPGTAAALTPHR